MKYTTEEALAEIMRRSEQITILRKNRRACQRFSAAAGALFAVLILVIAGMQEKPGITPAGSVYGAFLLSQQAGGYVLASVIAFTLGVAVTLLCLKMKKSSTRKKENQHENP